MAKGIRSKAKRQNRSALRATLSHPQIKKRQEDLAEALRKDLDEKNGSTIKGLKGIFPVGGLSTASIAVQQATMEVDEENKVELKKKSNKLEKPKVVKGSKARINLKKELSWF